MSYLDHQHGKETHLLKGYTNCVARLVVRVDGYQNFK